MGGEGITAGRGWYVNEGEFWGEMVKIMIIVIGWLVGGWKPFMKIQWRYEGGCGEEKQEKGRYNSY